jgi:transposase-like protein
MSPLAHNGLVNAVHQYIQGPCWQRCQTHCKQNIIDKTPSKLKDELSERIDEVLKADTPDEAKTAFIELADNFEDAIQVLHLPNKYRRRLRTTNSCERLIREIRRRERIIRILSPRRVGLASHRCLSGRTARRMDYRSTVLRYE